MSFHAKEVTGVEPRILDGDAGGWYVLCDSCLRCLRSQGEGQKNFLCS
jgi:hypothetical protein